MDDIELSPESKRLIAEVSAAANYDEGMALIAAFDFSSLSPEEREIVAERLNDILNENS